MGRLQIVLPDSLEDEMRDHAKKKGDISRIVTEALRNWLKEKAK